MYTYRPLHIYDMISCRRLSIYIGMNASHDYVQPRIPTKHERKQKRPETHVSDLFILRILWPSSRGQLSLLCVLDIAVHLLHVF